MEHTIVKAKARHWKLRGIALTALLVVIGSVVTLGPGALPPSHRNAAINRYLHSGQLLADMRTVAGMLQYLFEPEGAPWAA